MDEIGRRKVEIGDKLYAIEGQIKFLEERKKGIKY